VPITRQKSPVFSIVSLPTDSVIVDHAVVNIIGYVSIELTDICRSFLRVSKVTEKIKTRSKTTPSENFNSHPLQPDLSLADVEIHSNCLFSVLNKV
jgi:hypothetical protein